MYKSMLTRSSGNVDEGSDATDYCDYFIGYFTS